MARRELTVEPGEVLELADLRESRLRLEEIGVFEKVVLRPVLREEGKADLEVALKESHAFGGDLEFLGKGVANAITEKVRLTYHGLFGRAINVGGYYRWEKAAAQEVDPARAGPGPWASRSTSARCADRETQPFDVGGPTIMKAEGVEVGARRVRGLAHRDPARLPEPGPAVLGRRAPDTPPGVVRGLSLGLEHRFVESHRRKLDWSLSGFKAGKPLSSAVDYTKAVTALRYEDILSTPDDTDMEKSVIVARALGAWGDDDTPLDDLFALGVGSSDVDFPLRTYKLREDGVLGFSPMGRGLGLFNVEWRQRLVNLRRFQGGFVVFYDAAHIVRTAQGRRWDLRGPRASASGRPCAAVSCGWTTASASRATGAKC